MTWIIAILLGLILVAMVSSNQAAAAGVWGVIRFVIWGIAALIGWGILIGYTVWIYETYPPSGDWTQIIGVASAVIVPPLLLWLSRKEIVNAYRSNKWAAVKYGSLVIAYIFAMMVVGVVIREFQKAYEYGGWMFILVPLALISTILIWRSINDPKKLREIWFGPPELPDSWTVVENERFAAETAADASWDEIEKDWDNLTESEKTTATQERRLKHLATEVRLTELSKKLEAEKAARIKEEGNWSLRSLFWMFVFFTAIGLIGIIWDLGFAYAMELKFVKGQAWMAGAIVIGAMVAAFGLIASIWESITESNAKKT